jgi:hypothetical protein
MGIQARLQEGKSSDRRGAPRRRLALGSSLEATGEAVTIHDLSSSGMLIETAANLARGQDLEIELPHVGNVDAEVVWTSGRYFGCEFGEPLSKAAVSAALLRSEPPVERIEVVPRVKAVEASQSGEFDDVYEEKAPLGVRLRVILGSALILWALIIWAVISLLNFVRGHIG